MSGQNGCVLLVDDEASVRVTLGALLERSGYAVVSTETLFAICDTGRAGNDAADSVVRRFEGCEERIQLGWADDDDHSDTHVRGS